MNRIYLSPPCMTGEEKKLVEDAFKSNWIAPLGPHVDAFEKEMCKKTGAKNAVALSSGTSALHLALILLGVGAGDEVYLSSLTFAASANAVTYVGAVPHFIDSDYKSWNMDPDCLAQELNDAKKLNKLPKAVISVDIYGQCADYDAIQRICDEFEIPLIEDAAEALGATYKGKHAGTFGKMSILSFNGNKIITTSGGGMLLSPHKKHTEKALYLATQARDEAPHYQHSSIGYNYRLSNILAAIGRGQLGGLTQIIKKRRAIFDFYKKNLTMPGISFMPEASDSKCTRWLTCITIDKKLFGKSTTDIRLSLEKENIESRPVWKPMHMQPVFKECKIAGGKISEDLFANGLCLPSGTAMSDKDLTRVVEVILNTQK